MKKALLIAGFSIVFFNSQGQNCSVNIIKFQPSGECEGRDIQLLASPTAPGNIYSWSCPNTVYNSTSGPFLYIPMSCIADKGNYTLTVTDSSGCIAVAVLKVKVKPKPIVSISGQGFACQGTQTILTANDFSGNHGPYSYFWDNSSTTKSIKILHNGGTGPHPSCIITNANGCSASNQTAFMIGTIYPPQATISYSGLPSICSPASLLLNANQGVQLFYQWKKNGKNIAGATNSSLKAGSTGNYKVNVSDIYGCSSNSDVVIVNVYSSPSAAVTASESLTFCNGDSVVLSANSGNGYVYQWKKNGAIIPGATNISYTAKTAGNYKVEITNERDCSRLSDKKTVTINCKDDYSGLSQAEADGISIYPNPATTTFTFRFSTISSEQISIRLFDILGKEVESLQNLNPSENAVLGNNLNPGIYAAYISEGNKIKVIKLIKN